MEKLRNKIRANFPVISIETPEESRIEDRIVRLSREEKRSLFVWTITTGLRPMDLNSGVCGQGIVDPEDPRAAYAAISQVPAR